MTYSNPTTDNNAHMFAPVKSKTSPLGAPPNTTPRHIESTKNDGIFRTDTMQDEHCFHFQFGTPGGSTTTTTHASDATNSVTNKDLSHLLAFFKNQSAQGETPAHQFDLHQPYATSSPFDFSLYQAELVPKADARQYYFGIVANSGNKQPTTLFDATSFTHNDELIPKQDDKQFYFGVVAPSTTCA